MAQRARYPNLEALAQRGSVLVHQLTSIVFNNTDTIAISSLCGLASASVYTIYMLFFSNIEKLFYSIVNSISFRLGQLFYVEPEKFKRLYRLYDALYLSAAFALFTTVAVFLMPIIALYTSGVTVPSTLTPACWYCLRRWSCCPAPSSRWGCC